MRFLNWLSDPRRLPWLALLGMALTLPALNAGLMLDDFIHWSLLTGRAHDAKPGSPWGLFDFFDGHSDKILSMKASGQVMWWAANDVRLSFWRPLAEWTHWLDYRLWPHSPMLMHLHSTLWYGLLIWLLGRLYVQLNPSRTQAGLAVLVFALSSLHLTPVTWLAARNQLVAGCFTVLAIGAFHRWRSTASFRQGWLAGLFLALALLSAEAAVGTMGYFVAYCLAFSPAQSWGRRLQPVLPFLAIVIVWRLSYQWLGYGTTDSAFYIDPGAAPWRFANAMLLRMPALLLAALFGVPSASINNVPPQTQVLYAAGATAVIALFLLAARFYGLWRTPLARFFGLGALFALVPMCASEANDRLLLNTEIGACALFAMLLLAMIEQARMPHGWLAQGGRVLLGLSLVVHMVFFPIQTVAYSALKKRVMSPATIDEPLSLPDAANAPDQRVVLLNPPVAPLVYFYPLVRQYFGMHNPASLHALANGMQDLKVEMVDASTLQISGGPKVFTDSMGRDISLHPLKVGDVLDSGPIKVTVTEVSPQGAPMSVLFHFDRPLHDARWRFYLWTDEGYVPFKIPTPGETVTLHAPDIGKTLMRRIKSA
jgi:hypothetical protein